MSQTPSDIEAVRSFLYREAEYLDDFELERWLDLLAEDLIYRVPVRVTRDRGGTKSEFSDRSYIFDDNKEILASRVDRFEKEYAWAENPPYRTRRLVNNIRLADAEEHDITVGEDETLTKNNLLLAYSKADQEEPRLLSAERWDVIRLSSGGNHRLTQRRVFLDHTVTESIPRFL